MTTKVKKALEAVRAAKSAAERPLSKAEYHEFLEELLADTEGWQMVLDEEKDD